MKPCFAVDQDIFDQVSKAGLPSDIILRPINPELDDLDNLTGPDGFLLGFILAPAHEGSEVAELLPEALREGGVFILAKRNEKALSPWCWQRFAAMSTHLLGEYARAHLALAASRARIARLETSLAAAEAAFVDFRKEPLKLALRLPASGVYANPFQGLEAAGLARLIIRQEVPVLLGNVIYVDLFFNRDGASLAGTGRLTIAAAYSGHLLCDQMFAYAEISQGWQRFTCFNEDLLDRQPLRLTLELSGTAGADLLPGLSDPTPLTHESASLDGIGPTGRPLALQIWTGIAGIAYPRHVNALATDTGRDRAGQEKFSLPPDVLAAAQPYLIGRHGLDFSPVAYQGTAQSLLVHPLGLVPTVARLAQVNVTGLTYISALVQLDGPAAKPTDFAIFATLSGERPPRFDDARHMPTLSWLNLHRGEWGEAGFALPHPVTGPVDIYLLAKNQTPDYDLSWAFFRGITLDCDPA